jgi:hypothetical protein
MKTIVSENNNGYIYERTLGSHQYWGFLDIEKEHNFTQ